MAEEEVPLFQGRAGRGRGGGGSHTCVAGEGRAEGVAEERGVAEEAFGLRFRGGPGKGVAEEDMGAGRRAAAEGR